MSVPLGEGPEISWEEMLAELLRAGEAADRRQAHAEARQHYEAALDALGHLPETDLNRRRRIDLTIKRVSVSIRTDSADLSLTQLIQAESLLQGLMTADKARLARIYYTIAHAHTALNETRAAVGYYRQVLPVAEELGDEELLAIPASALGQLLVRQGRLDQAQALLMRASPLLEKAEKWSEWAATHAHLGIALAGQGEYAAGLVETDRALKRAKEWLNLTGVAQSYVAQAAIYRFGGEAGRALEASRAALQVVRKSGDPALYCFAYAYRAWAESQIGQLEAAQASLKSAQAALDRSEGQALGAEIIAAYRAQLALNAGQAAEAAQLAEYAHRAAYGNLLAAGLASRVQGQTQLDDAEAEAALARSLEIFEAGGCRLEAAHTHLAWARLSQQHGETAVARLHAEQAAAQYAASGLWQALEQTHAWR